MALGSGRASAGGRAVQVDPIKPTLKAPGTQRLNLKCDGPLSNVAFKFNLRRYIMLDASLRAAPVQRSLMPTPASSAAPSGISARSGVSAAGASAGAARQGLTLVHLSAQL